MGLPQNWHQYSCRISIADTRNGLLNILTESIDQNKTIKQYLNWDHYFCCCWNMGEREMLILICVISLLHYYYCSTARFAKLSIWPRLGFQGLGSLCCWMPMTKVLSSPQEVSLSLLPITTKCSVVLVEERSKTSNISNWDSRSWLRQVNPSQLCNEV